MKSILPHPYQHWLCISLCALFLLLSGCASSSRYDGAPIKSALGKQVIKTASTQLGRPYKYGGSSPTTGFDCSGLIQWTFAKHGIFVPRTTKEQAKFGEKVSRRKLQPADILVFRIGRGSLHTALYTGNGRFIHSPSSKKKVRIESMDTEYWKKRLIGMRRPVR